MRLCPSRPNLVAGGKNIYRHSQVGTLSCFPNHSLLGLSNRIAQAGHMATDGVSWLIFSLVMKLSSGQWIWDVSRHEMYNRYKEATCLLFLPTPPPGSSICMWEWELHSSIMRIQYGRAMTWEELGTI